MQERELVNVDKTYWNIGFVGFVILILDGIDTVILPLLIPSLSKQWGIAPSAFTLPLMFTNIGAVLGFISSGWLCSRYGFRTTLVSTVVWFGSWTVAAVPAVSIQSIEALTITRLFAGFGLGLAIPTTVSMVTAFARKEHQSRISVMATMGIGVGAALAGFAGTPIIRELGVDGALLAAGVLPMLVALFALFYVPKLNIAQSFAPDHAQASISRLFDKGYGISTSLLWVFAFAIFTTAYALQSWIPALLTLIGFDAVRAPIGVGFLTMGIVAGGVALFLRPIKIRTEILIATLGLMSMLFIWLLTSLDVSSNSLLLLLIGAGIGIGCGQYGQVAMAVEIYPASARTTGVGMASGAARMGSIVGPAIGGGLLAIGLEVKDILFTSIIPLGIAIVCIVALALRRNRCRRDL